MQKPKKREPRPSQLPTIKRSPGGHRRSMAAGRLGRPVISISSHSGGPKLTKWKVFCVPATQDRTFLDLVAGDHNAGKSRVVGLAAACSRWEERPRLAVASLSLRGPMARRAIYGRNSRRRAEGSAIPGCPKRRAHQGEAAGGNSRKQPQGQPVS